MAEKSKSGIKERDDGFFEVPGVAGYFTKEDAERVARQMAVKKAEEPETDEGTEKKKPPTP